MSGSVFPSAASVGEINTNIRGNPQICFLIFCKFAVSNFTIFGVNLRFGPRYLLFEKKQICVSKHKDENTNFKNTNMISKHKFHKKQITIKNSKICFSGYRKFVL